MELRECLNLANKFLSELFGEGYEKKSVQLLHIEAKRKARKIIKSLKPFAHHSTFPETYNPRALHAVFALAFLYYSPFFYDFIRVVRLRVEPKTKKTNASEFVVEMIETIRHYQYMGQYRHGAIRYYDEMSTLFKKAHADNGFSGVVNDQLVVCIDFTNPIEHIKSELEKVIRQAQDNFDDQFREMAMNAGVLPEFVEKGLPSKLAAPVEEEKDNPKIYLPHWYQALTAHRLRLLKHGELARINVVCSLSKTIDRGNKIGGSGKTTTHNRLKLAERLIHSSFNRIPMTTFHTKSSCL